MKQFFIFFLIIGVVYNGSAQCSNIFFSEYIEGTGNNRAIEVYNPTNLTIDLSDYIIHINSNGATSPTNYFQPVGTLAPGNVYVITNSQAVGNIPLVSDTTSGLISFDGNDAIWIEEIISSDTIDVIGEIGVSPGSDWTVGTGSTEDYTLIRKIAIQSGQSNWAIGSLEWDVYPINMADSLGIHSGTPCPIACTPTSSNINVGSCTTYTSPSGITYNTSGIYNDTILNYSGCDSIITFLLQIYPPTFGDEIAIACDSFTWTNGITYTASTQTPTDTLINSNGCDSIITLNLIIHHSTAYTSFLTNCGPTFIIDNTGLLVSISSDTTIIDTLVTTNGCDSILTINFIINDAYYIIDSITTCNDAYTWTDGNTYTTDNNTATINYLSMNGCDSVIVLDLTFIDIDNSISYQGTTLTANETGANYQWLDCDNNFTPILGATSQIYVPTAVIGTYAVLVSIGDCSDTSECQFVYLTTEDQNPLSSVSVFPNPNHGLITIDLNTLNNVNINLVDVCGRTVLDIKGINQKLYQLEHQLPTGIYFLGINTKGSSRTFKLIVQ